MAAVPATPGSSAAGASNAIIECGGCYAPSIVDGYPVQWNQYLVYNKGKHNERRVPTGDSCLKCAVGWQKGDFVEDWNECKEKSKKDPRFVELIKSTGKLALDVDQKTIRDGDVKYGDTLGRESVESVVKATVRLRSFGKVVSPEDFEKEKGYSHTELGMEVSTLTNQFCSKSGLVVEDETKPAEVIIESVHEIGKDVFAKIMSNSPNVNIYSASQVEQKRQAKVEAAAAMGMTSATALVDADMGSDEDAVPIAETAVQIDEVMQPPGKRQRRGAGSGGRGSRSGGRGRAGRGATIGQSAAAAAVP
eukprot:8082587-Pyramimonas_sp.AAC.1